MIYYVTIEEGGEPRRLAVDLVELPDGAFEASVDGRPFTVDVAEVGAHLCARIDGRVVDATFEGRLPHLGVTGRGLRARVHVESERDALRPLQRTRVSGGPKVVTSPMPGRVIRVLVRPGEAVGAGQALLVLEAMKMENEVRASHAAVVVDVHVAPGVTLEANAKLVTLSAPAS